MQQGVVGISVSAVAAGSRAAANGLRAGDLIVATNQGPFDSLSSFRAIVNQRNQPLALEVIRGGQRGQLLMR